MKQTNTIKIAPLVLALMLLTPGFCKAGSATWNLIPASGDWNTSANWTPATVPNGSSDTATFGSSNTTNLFLSSNTEVSSIVFDSGASPFTIAAGPRASMTLTISGTGISNNSGSTQNFVTTANSSTDFGAVVFTNNATAGSSTMFTNGPGPVGYFGAQTEFFGNATAGSATFINNGGVVTFSDTSTAADSISTNNGATVSGALGGFTLFLDTSRADEAIFTNNAGTVSGAYGGAVTFTDSATARHAAFTNNGATVSGAIAGHTYFIGFATARNCVVINNGGVGSNAQGGFTMFSDGTAGNSTLIANGGSNGGTGGKIIFDSSSKGGTARVELFGNGNADLTSHNVPISIGIGSLEGSGILILGANALSVGTNSLSTGFFGVIEDGDFASGGSLIKVGEGVLGLAGASTYTGGTTVSSGALFVSNTTGSATGAGAVQVIGGSLGGNGIIAGAVTIGGGNGTGAALTPGAATRRPARLTINSSLSFKADASYTCRLYPSKAKADSVTARGVSIESGAIFFLLGPLDAVVAPGTVFTLVDNDSGGAIRGAFSYLADGATITIGTNTFQANYEGGDGNDLTLTAVP